MDHSKNSRTHVSTDSKFSPDVKKLKLSDSPNSNNSTHKPMDHSGKTQQDLPEVKGHVDTNNMAAPSTVKRPLFSEALTDSPPQWFRDFEGRLDSKIESLFEKLTKKIQEQEERIQNLDFEVEKVRKEVDVVKKDNELLKLKLDDLENRNRRKNVVIFGIPESEGGKEDCHKVVSDFLRFAGVESEDLKAIERCHRTPSSLHNYSQNGKPRMIHIGFATFVAKERVRKACISKMKECKLYHNSKLFIAEDLSKRVLDLRKKKMPQFHRLREEGRRPFFTYPDRLCFRDNTSGKLVIADPS